MKKFILITITFIFISVYCIIKFEWWIKIMPDYYQEIYHAINEANENGWPNFVPNDSLTTIIDYKLDSLRLSGLHIPSKTTGYDLALFYENDIELAQSYDVLMYVLGSRNETNGSYFFSNSNWKFDMECIYGNGDYIYIVEQLNRISGDNLQIDNISDSVDVINKFSAISFDLFGEKFKYKLKYQDDWMDFSLLQKLSEIVRRHGNQANFVYFNTEGQELNIGWLTKAQFEILKELGVKNMEWIE